jgi:hypothetical protein
MKMKLWKNNRIDQEYELENKVIIGQFVGSKYYQNVLLGMNLDRCLRGFICSDDGLKSVFEEGDYDILLKELLEVLRKRKDWNEI